MLTLVLAMMLQTTGRTYTNVPLDSVPLVSRSYVRTVGKVVSATKLSSGTMRWVIEAGDSRLTVDCPKATRTACPSNVLGQIVAVFGKRYKSSTVGWQIRPVDGVHIATPGTYTSCVKAGVRDNHCWLGQPPAPN